MTITMAFMHQLRPAPPPLPPGILGAFARLVSPGGGAFANLALPGGRPRGQPRAFATHAVSYQNITTQRILLEKQADWLTSQGREKLTRFVKACSRLYACISSLLIKAELHSETRNQRFFGY